MLDEAAPRTCCALPYRIRAPHVEVLLVTTSAGRWVLPKGRMLPSEAPFEAAAREAWEEGGVRGNIDELPYGGFDHEKNGATEHILVYPLAVNDEAARWPESSWRQRRWVTANEVAALVDTDLAGLVGDFAAEADAMIGDGVTGQD
ncbi:NUDIX domain-containing protein [Mesorhizobium sp. BR1-1-16]|uniref:NUDIX hydrolase n=1 Tax=Mesorhizobium sp. BR1-1-16 TaxID=2876653 RepID=UPI001CCD9780|nr:NUDIX domain-containing protein [Mesorhizobium sp. BR1-1-16]MBZ9938698.1 NUDIX domain-containing protein [Mesorhizobium sp. BR1-1-16]